MLVPMPERLARWITDLGFFAIIYNTGSDPGLAFVASRSGQDFEWSCVDLEVPSFFTFGRRES